MTGDKKYADNGQQYEEAFTPIGTKTRRAFLERALEVSWGGVLRHGLYYPSGFGQLPNFRGLIFGRY